MHCTNRCSVFGEFFFTRSFLASDPSAFVCKEVFDVYLCICVFEHACIYISFGIWRLEQDVILEARVARCFFICVVFGLGFFSASVFVFLEISFTSAC